MKKIKFTTLDAVLTGKKIHNLLNKNGCSVKELQEMLELECPQSIYKWLHGRALPSLDNLYLMHRLFGVHMENMLVPVDAVENGGYGMEEQTYKGRTYLEYANEAASKIRETSRLLSGTEAPEDGSLLGGIDDCIYTMVKMYLISSGIEATNDELDDMAISLMFAKQDEIQGIIKMYCGFPG